MLGQPNVAEAVGQNGSRRRHKRSCGADDLAQARAAKGVNRHCDCARCTRRRDLSAG
jgi:hypothetical protein